MVSLLGCYKLFIVDHRARNYFCRQYHLCLYISSLVLVFIVTVMFILNFVHCETTACDSDNKQSLILSSVGVNASKVVYLMSIIT